MTRGGRRLEAWTATLLGACTLSASTEGPPPAPVVEDAPVPAAAEHPLATFFGALQDAERGEGVATVVHFGASHTASDTFTGPLRDHLQGRFGDAGRGLLPAGTPWRWFRAESTVQAQDGDWTGWRGTKSTAVGPFGITGIRQHAEEEGAWLSRATCTRCTFGRHMDRLDLHILRVPGGGSYRIVVDGGVLTTRGTDLRPGESEALRAARSPEEVARYDAREVDDDLPTPPDVGRLEVVRLELGDGPHEVRLEAVGDGPVMVLGTDATRDVPGVRYHNLAINGIRADQFLQLTPRIVHEELRRLDPQLMVLHWGINEMYSDRYGTRAEEPTAADWAAGAVRQTETYRAVIRRVREAAPEADCLVLLPTDLVPRTHWTFPEDAEPCVEEVPHPWIPEDETVCVRRVPVNHGAIRAAQIAAAEAEGCATWDQQAATGGPGSLNLWRHLDPPLAKEDGIHLMLEGYALLADTFHGDLMQAYEDWRVTGDPAVPLRTSVVDVQAVVQARREAEAE